MKKRGLSFPAIIIIVLFLIMIIIASFFVIPIIKERFVKGDGGGLRMINNSKVKVDDSNVGSGTSDTDSTQTTTKQEESNKKAEDLIELQEQIPNCTNSDWVYNITPLDCPLSGEQIKNYTKIGDCENGVSHSVSEIISCAYNVPTCTSFTYTDWSECGESGTQARNVLSSLPSGCQNGVPVLSQECVYVPSTCIDGTSLNSCSLTKPLYCDGNGELDYDCSLCGCDSKYVCEGGSCVIEEVFQEGLCYDDIVLSDLTKIKNAGFNKIRIISYVRYPGELPTWPNDVFISFPNPTNEELEDLMKYLSMLEDSGLYYEFVFNIPDSNGMYYTHGITTQDYKDFIDAVWPSIWVGGLSRIVFGGDLYLEYNVLCPGISQEKINSHRQFTQEVWSYLYDKCPTCNVGIEVAPGCNNLYDYSVASTEWIKDNVSPEPHFIGYQYYPTTAVANLYDDSGTIDWNSMVDDWYNSISAVSGDIPIYVDEVGMQVSNLNYGQTYFTEQEQDEFFDVTLNYFNEKGLWFNIWEYTGASNSGIGQFWLVDDSRDRMAWSTVSSIVEDMHLSINRGIQYQPFESVGWQHINGLCNQIPLSPNLDTAEIRGSGNSKILIVDKDIKFPAGHQFTGQVAIAKEGVVLDCNGGTISGYETSFDKGIVVYSNGCAEDDSKLIKEISDHPSSNYKYYISPDIHDVTIKNCKVEGFVRGIDLVRYIYTRSFAEKDTNGEPIDLDGSCVGPHKSQAVHPLIACAIDKVINLGYLFLGDQCNQHWLGAVDDPPLQGKALRREYYKRATAFYTKSTQELETPGIIETALGSESPLFQFVTRNIIIDNVEATDSNVGIYVDAYSSGFTIQNSNLHDNVRGIYLELGSSNTKIIDSQIINNENIGIAVDASFHNHIEGNIFERNGHAGIALYKNCGEKFEESVYAPVRYSGSNYNLIKDNFFTDHRLHEGQSSNIPTIQYPDSIAMKDPRSAGIWVAPRDGMLMEKIVRQDGRILSCTGNLYDGETSGYPLRATIFSDNGEQLNAWNDYSLGNEITNNIFTNNLYDKIIYNQPLSGEELPSLTPWITIKSWFRRFFS
jgi:parallel beta-helix repeat protein